MKRKIFWTDQTRTDGLQWQLALTIEDEWGFYDLPVYVHGDKATVDVSVAVLNERVFGLNTVEALQILASSHAASR
ncbi:hypothetical protein AB0941_42635 [Streptomyces sp. NPDC013433]